MLRIIYLILGITLGFIIAYSIESRPNCFDYQYMAKDLTGEYSCFNK